MIGSILPYIQERVSVKQFSSVLIDVSHLKLLLEAARWTPSSNNTQPWRFLVAKRDGERFNGILRSMAPANAEWAFRASHLIVASVYTSAEERFPNRHATYDLGQAVSYLTIQATSLGIATHQIGGFDPQALASRVGMSTAMQPVVIVALGYFDPTVQLSKRLTDRGAQRRSRLALQEIAVGDL
ncbi:nitroreductase family protein [Aureimonas altamirensis]|uniref:nitroreductase family protein n=1 Tax=Aureimonas altamirensis TaxID=370622 RepID=UPI0025525469|nr:nitroreductase family protein [Aureimonas altamirensis]